MVRRPGHAAGRGRALHGMSALRGRLQAFRRLRRACSPAAFLCGWVRLRRGAILGGQSGHSGESANEKHPCRIKMRQG